MDLFVYVLERHQLATTVKIHIKVSFSKCIQIKKKKVSDQINIKQTVGLGAGRAWVMKRLTQPSTCRVISETSYLPCSHTLHGSCLSQGQDPLLSPMSDVPTMALPAGSVPLLPHQPCLFSELAALPAAQLLHMLLLPAAASLPANSPCILMPPPPESSP